MIVTILRKLCMKIIISRRGRASWLSGSEATRKSTWAESISLRVYIYKCHDCHDRHDSENLPEHALFTAHLRDVVWIGKGYTLLCHGSGPKWPRLNPSSRSGTHHPSHLIHLLVLPGPHNPAPAVRHDARRNREPRSPSTKTSLIKSLITGMRSMAKLR